MAVTWDAPADMQVMGKDCSKMEVEKDVWVTIKVELGGSNAAVSRWESHEILLH